MRPPESSRLLDIGGAGAPRAARRAAAPRPAAHKQPDVLPRDKDWRSPRGQNKVFYGGGFVFCFTIGWFIGLLWQLIAGAGGPGDLVPEYGSGAQELMPDSGVPEFEPGPNATVLPSDASGRDWEALWHTYFILLAIIGAVMVAGWFCGRDFDCRDPRGGNVIFVVSALSSLVVCVGGPIWIIVLAMSNSNVGGYDGPPADDGGGAGAANATDLPGDISVSAGQHAWVWLLWLSLLVCCIWCVGCRACFPNSNVQVNNPRYFDRDEIFVKLVFATVCLTAVGPIWCGAPL